MNVRGTRSRVPIGEQLSAPRKFVAACVLVLLHDQPGHGYELVQRFDAMGVTHNPAKVYRCLRWLEDAGLASPTWKTPPGRGPARRVYALTPAGTAALSESASALRRHARTRKDRWAKYLLHRLAVVQRPDNTFAFTVNVRLMVMALDPESGHRKIQRLFATPGAIHEDVRPAGLASISGASTSPVDRKGRRSAAPSPA